MALTFVLRVADTTPSGEIVARVEAVASGAVEVIHSVDDLAAFLLDHVERARTSRGSAIVQHPNTSTETLS